MKSHDLEAIAKDLKKIGEELRKAAAPIDFEALSKSGLLTKIGAWYAVANMDQLPQNVAARISAVKIGKDGRPLVKLKKGTEFERLAKKFKQFGT